jgi:glycosyl transferase, family 25
MTPPVYLINLKKSPERLAKSTKRLAEQKIDFLRVEGVLGQELTEEEINQHYSKELNVSQYHTPLTKGQIGCYLSHRKAWRFIAEGDADFGIILEDDFILSGSLAAAIECIETLDFPWGLIKLAAYQSRERAIAFQKAISDDFKLVVHAKPMSGGAATALTKEAAKKLLLATNKFGRPCDTDIQHFWETQVSVLSLMPFPVAQDMSFESTISAKKITRKKYFWRRKLQQLKSSYQNDIAVKVQIEQLKSQLTK